MKYSGMIFLGMLIITSCGYQLWFKPKYFDASYHEKYTGIDTLIQIEGCYLSDINTVIVSQTVSDIEATKTVDLVLLYKNGIIMTTGSYPLKNDIEAIIDKYKSKKIRHKHLTYQWGTYQISDDTIKAQIIVDYGPMMSPGVFEKRFLIVSDTVIKKIYQKELTPDYPPNPIEGSGLYNFYSYTNRIETTSNPYVHKKWFWNKDAYKAQKRKN